VDSLPGLGPYKVIRRTNEVAYTLDLPDALNIHPTFHVSLLREFKDNGSVQPPQPIMIDNHISMGSTVILAHRENLWARPEPDRVLPKRLEYLVKWLGQGPEHNT
jgi:hypothetical protein